MAPIYQSPLDRINYLLNCGLTSREIQEVIKISYPGYNESVLIAEINAIQYVKSKQEKPSSDNKIRTSGEISFSLRRDPPQLEGLKCYTEIRGAVSELNHNPNDLEEIKRLKGLLHDLVYYTEHMKASSKYILSELSYYKERSIPTFMEQARSGKNLLEIK